MGMLSQRVTERERSEIITLTLILALIFASHSVSRSVSRSIVSIISGSSCVIEAIDTSQV